MLNEKVENYFEKYPDLRILFLFDEKKEYLDEITNWTDTDILLIKAGDALFDLKYRLYTYPLIENLLTYYLRYHTL